MTDSIVFFLVSLVALAVLTGFLWLFGNIIYEFVVDIFSSTTSEIKIAIDSSQADPLSEEQKGLLAKYFHYYNSLAPEQKVRFEKRVAAFLKGKMFFDENNQLLDERIALMIGACAVQLTFGLALFRLGHFNRIHIFQSQYYVGGNEDKVYFGHVIPSGSIYLSWEAFSFGYKDNADGLNTGIHEMAHALEVENRFTRRDLEFLERFQIWEKLAGTEMLKLREGRKSVLRSYGSQNLHEMFAVCCECFFELTDQMEKELPELFQIMRKVLRQDPRLKESPVLSEMRIDKPNVMINPKREIERIKQPFYKDIPAISILTVIFFSFSLYYWIEIKKQPFPLLAVVIFVLILFGMGIYYQRAKRQAEEPGEVKSRQRFEWRKAVSKTLMLIMLLSMITAIMPLSVLYNLGLIPEMDTNIIPNSLIVFLISTALMGVLNVTE